MSENVKMSRRQSAENASNSATGGQGEPACSTGSRLWTNARAAGRDAAREGAKTAAGSRRLRAQAAPWAVAGVVATGATVVAAVGSTVALLVLVGLTAAAGALWATRDRQAGRAYPAVAAGAALSWETAAATVASPGELIVPLLAGTAALGLPWWRRHRAEHPDVTAEQLAALEPPHPEPEPAQTPWQLQRYQRHLAGAGCPLAGTWPAELTPIPYGFQMIINWPEGRVHDELWDPGPWRKLRSIYGVPSERISAETLPGRPQDQARVTVLTTDPLERGVTWSDPPVVNGVTTIGVYSDGRDVPYEFWNHEGACHGIISGCSGSGKSKLLTNLLLVTLRTDWMLPWLLDGQRGASSPRLVRYADRAGRGPEESLARLRQIRAIMDDRERRMPHMTWTDGKGRTQQGVGKITPNPGLPQIVVFMDEAQHILAHKEAVSIVTRLVEQGRKLGISLVLLTQVPSAGSLNSLTGMREQLLAFNIVALRMKEQFTSGMAKANEMPTPPHKLPKEFDSGAPTNGVGYKVDDRPVLMRAAHVPDDDEIDWAEGATATRLEPEAQRAAATATGEPPPVDPSPAAGGSEAVSTIARAQERIAALHTSN